MIPLPQAKGQRYGVMGLGKSGRAAASALLASGAEVLAWDDRGLTALHIAASRGRVEGTWAGGEQTEGGVPTARLGCRARAPLPTCTLSNCTT